ncbi:hypothetical protein ABIA32_004467 [Streptacidiphilus sp. MAP12-20]|uniref:hypothetical protein n=1 Tax=Streptacidiphilus sp. MAP12-20 TaxID=3156299 RepID=UPI003518F463
MTGRTSLSRATGAVTSSLACGLLACCTGAPPAVPPAPTAAHATPAQAAPEGATLNSELQQADDMARSVGGPPPTEGSWVAYRDATGMDWILWSAADGRLCHWRSFASMMGCPTDRPEGGRPAFSWFAGSWEGPDWVYFLAADQQQQVQELTCGTVGLSVRKLADFPLGHGSRVIYAIHAPWGLAGRLHAQVLRSAGPMEEVLPFASDLKTSNFMFHVCP